MEAGLLKQAWEYDPAATLRWGIQWIWRVLPAERKQAMRAFFDRLHGCLKGRRTYLVIVIAMVMVVLQIKGIAIPKEVWVVLGFSGLGFLRASVGNISKVPSEEELEQLGENLGKLLPPSDGSTDNGQKPQG